MNNLDKASEIELVKEAIKVTKASRLKERYLIIHQYLKGLKIKDIAELNCVSTRTISRCIKIYKGGGLAALSFNFSKGAPRKVSSHIATLVTYILEKKSPCDMNLPKSYQWTISLVKELLKIRFRIDLCKSAVHIFMYRIEFSYTMPTYTLARASKTKQEDFKNRFKKLKEQLHLGDIDNILFQDESAIRDYLSLQKCWFPKGRQRIIKTYGQHLTVKLLGVLNYETGHVYCEERDKYDAHTFVEFMTNVLSLYPEGKIAMILDNARIHHSKIAKEFLQKHTDRLQLEFLPPYSPNLNLIEGLWGWLKTSVIRNRFFSKIYEIKKDVKEFIDYINSISNQVIDRLCLSLD
ncbi:IS630 family transposase [Romboutsia sp.]|uniref:IS630 family transposase n=1 Tax=Romboutsia sp. TaxID=1965302 RepID=UPI003F2CCD8A